MGRAEQISARTKAVIIMNTKVMMNEDLEFTDETFEPMGLDGTVPDCCRTACKQTEEDE